MLDFDAYLERKIVGEDGRIPATEASLR